MNERDIFLDARETANLAARTAFLAKACGDDAALQMRIERLLRADADADNILDMPAVTPATAPAAKLPEEESSDGDLLFLKPSNRPDSLGRIGHYEVLEVLGKGGCGIVLRAYDEQLARVVAIKVLAPQMAFTSAACKRFLREARCTAAVRHANVIQVYEVGEERLPYLVMEFIPGETLQQRLDRSGPLDVPELLRIGQEIAEGLAAAHATGLIHRDVKPANVLIESSPNGQVKLTDFGLARTTDDASLTQSGTIAGTPMYMSPEQARGDRLDHRTDLFSLGSVLYLMTSGRPPFRAANSMAVLKRVNEDTPRPITEIIPETPVWLCDIIARLQAKNPEERFSSAQEVADLFAHYLTNLASGTLAPPVRQSDPRSHGRRWPIAAAVLFLLISGLGLSEAFGVTDLFSKIVRRFAPEEVVRINREIPPVVPVDPVPKAGEADREAAVWALSSGGNAHLDIVVDDKEIHVTALDQLPKTPFELRAFNVNRNKYVTDDGLIVLKGLKHLTVLQITNTRATDKVLPYIKDCKKLKHLFLYNFGLTDAGLPHLEGFSELDFLSVKQTNVTEQAVRKLAAALPKCRIEWNGGLIEPK